MRNKNAAQFVAIENLQKELRIARENATRARGGERISARQQLADEMRDGSYGDVWHDNIACCISDELTSNKIGRLYYDVANDAATRIMKHCFGVDTVVPSKRTPAAERVIVLQSDLERATATPDDHPDPSWTACFALLSQRISKTEARCEHLEGRCKHLEDVLKLTRLF